MFVASKLIYSHAVTPCWLDDAKECTQLGWSKQRDCCSSAHEIPAADASCFESCISWKSFGSEHLNFRWIFDWIPREEALTFQFVWYSNWKLSDTNFWVKICLVLEISKMSFPPLSQRLCWKHYISGSIWHKSFIQMINTLSLMKELFIIVSWI